MESNTESVIEAQGLTCAYGKTEVVSGLSFSVPKGSAYALLGANGAGKTTTIKTLLNILTPVSGSSSVLGTSSRNLGEDELRQIGYVSESQQIPGGLTVKQLVDFCRALYPGWDDAYCDRLLQFFELPLDKKISQLSRGMRIKAALTVSLAYHPKLLVLDEPFSGLDPLMRDDLIDGILEVTQQEEWSILVSSHDIDEIEKLADHIGIVDNGVLLVNEQIDRLLERYKKVSFYASGIEASGAAPTNWRQMQAKDGCFSFMHNAYDGERIESEIKAVYPDANQITAVSVSLREIVKSVLKGASIDRRMSLTS